MSQPIKRGDIYFFRMPTGVEGAEHLSHTGERPGIVVSNNACNRFSNLIEIVWLTTNISKKRLPTHVEIESSKYKSLAMCEAIVSVDVGRIETFLGRCTDEEMINIDRALMVSLGIEVEL